MTTEAYSRGYCVCCGVQRDEEGHMKHDEECMWFGAIDIDKIDREEKQRTTIFVPYIPEIR